MGTRRRRVRALCAAIALLAAGIANADSVSSFGWLSGCWASDGGEPGSGEFWISAHGGTLLGISRTVRDGKTVAHEFMQIRPIEPGKLAFIARPSGQAEATFALVRSSATELVFENPAHDYPQRVIYRLHPPNALLGRIEGTLNGVLKAVEFPMTRIQCP